MGKENFWDRLSTTETYASRKLKEKKITVKSAGRPLYNIEIPPEPTSTTRASEISPSLSQVSSFSATSRSIATSNSYMSTSSRKSFASSRSSRTTSSQGSVFDRLSSTGTKSSLRKHKKSELYDNVKEIRKEEGLLRKFEGNTNVLSTNLGRCTEERRRKLVSRK